ncbi:CASP-like protein 2U7 [Selaginella moellendorffii]|uniref:CASP-like protein 2U7 n=1 Tax=Selaginella moellendorffii TaxID=88036 RepID=UPI000D1CF681|nr:CASP-like protein 2U7 [Selaginella moellendorffii]|eukprot:XP_024539644.1 CASP-like protein 2U7 [Selaginella moellendorffii]
MLELYEKRRALLLLRLAAMFLSLAALLITVLNREDGFFSINVFGSPQPILAKATADFTLVKGLKFFAGAMGIVAGYSFLQLAIAMASIFSGAPSILGGKRMAWLCFVGDMTASHLCAAAAAVSAQLAYLGKRGAPMWSAVCTYFSHYCLVFGLAVILAFLATLAALLVASISSYHLFRLYGILQQQQQQQRRQQQEHVQDKP